MTDYLVPVYIGATFILVYALLGFVMDGKLLPAVKTDVRNALNVSQQGRGGVNLFIAMFDRMFDPAGRGRPCLGRTLLALAVVIFLMLVGWATALPERAENIFDYQSGWLGSILMLSGILVMTNVIGGIFSLWETRLVAGWMAVAGAPAQACLLLLDIIATLLVYGAGLFIGFLIHPATHGVLLETLQDIDSVSGFMNAYFSSSNLLYVGKSLLFCPPDDGFLDLRFVNDLLSMGFYAALLPSVWLWASLLGMKAWPPFKWLGGVLHADRYPAGAATTLGATLIALAAFVLVYGLQLHQTCV